MTTSMAPPTPQPKPVEAMPAPWKRWLLAAKPVIIKHWLPIVFAVAIVFALAWPQPGTALLKVVVLGDVRIIQEVAMGIVFFLSGWALDTKDLTRAKGHIFGVVFGFVSILFITPCMGFITREIPLEPKLFAIGLTIFCVAPTTLGVGLALTRSCKGNDGIALLMTVGTNLLGVVTMPLLLKLLFIGYDLSGLDIEINILDLFIKLIITVLVPSVVGKVLRDCWGRAASFAQHWRQELSMFSTACLAFIVWQTLSGARHVLFESKAWSIMVVIVLGCSLYLFYLAVHYLLVKWVFKMTVPEGIAVMVMASQKSAPVAVTVISYLTSDLETQGLLAVAPIVGQLAQIFIGAALAPSISTWADSYHAGVAAAAAASRGGSSHGRLPAPPGVEVLVHRLSDNAGTQGDGGRGPSVHGVLSAHSVGTQAAEPAPPGQDPLLEHQELERAACIPPGVAQQTEKGRADRHE